MDNTDSPGIYRDGKVSKDEITKLLGSNPRRVFEGAARI